MIKKNSSQKTPIIASSTMKSPTITSSAIGHRRDVQQKTMARTRGEYAEQKVAEYFTQRHYDILYHQKKIFGVEFDWVFTRETAGGTELTYVEVKSVRHPDFFLQRWPWKQKQRFIRVASVLSAQRLSYFYLALVDYHDRIHLFRVGDEIG